MNHIEAMKQMVEALENMTKIRDGQREKGYPLSDADKKMQRAIAAGRQAIAEAESVASNDTSQKRVDKTSENVHEQEPVACDGDFPEGFDKSFGIPAQALRQANAALCEVTNNRMWDVPALAERMLLFCRNTRPQPKREPLTHLMHKQMRENCDSHEMRGAFVDGWTSAEAAHGIKEKNGG